MSSDMMGLHIGTYCPKYSGMVADSQITSFRSIIGLWASREAMASDIGARSSIVRKWWQRDKISDEWWSAVLETDIAKANGVSAEVLTRLAARRETEEARA